MFYNRFTWMMALPILLICGVAYADSSKENSPFNETTWRIEKIDQQKKFVGHYQGDLHYTYLRFNPYTHKVTGSGLCNKFLAKFTNQQDQLKITDLNQQHATCLSEAVNAQDNLFFNHLKSVKFFEVKGKILTLMDADKHVLLVAKKY